MAHTSSGSSSSSDFEVDSFSKSCVKAYAILKEQYDNLNSDNNKSQFNLVSYKAVRLRDNALIENKMILEKVEKERDELKLTLEKFQNSSKSLNSLLESQVIDKFKTGLGYNAATAPYPPVESFVNSSKMTGKINTAGAKVNTAVRPVNTVGSKPTVNHPRLISNAYKKGYSQVTRSVNKSLANKNSIFNKKVNTVRVKDTTATDRAVVSENKGIGANVVKASQKEYKEKGVIDSGCSRHMTGNKCYLTEYEDYDGGFVSFGDGKGRISGKGKIKTGKLDFDNVYFCKELKYNLFSVSQICDKKNNVLFTDTECLVLSSDFKLLDESQVLLRVPRKDNIYSVDLKSVVPTKGLTCLIAKATIDESNLWHRRLGHTNFKNMNKLVRGNLVRGLPSKIFENDHSCVACQKGKQHKASYKAKLVNSISKPLHMLHMDLFGPTNVKSLMKKSYCLVVTDDFRIKREFSVARTPQQNGVAERKNRTLIEAAKTMVLVIKPHNKTPYELIRGRPPLIDFMKPFGCPVTILNTRDHLGKFDGNANEGYFVGYFMISPKDSEGDTEMKPIEVDDREASDKMKRMHKI
ncbi:putative ribonuclease H-like domain-containing protein [Tanacetum coccineum]